MWEVLAPVLSFTQIQTVGVLRDELHQKKQINRLPVFPKEEMKGIEIKAVLSYHSNQLLTYSGSCFSLTRAGLETTGWNCHGGLWGWEGGRYRTSKAVLNLQMSLPFRAVHFVCVFQVMPLTFWEKQLPHCSSTRFMTVLSVSSATLTTQMILHWSTAVCTHGMPGYNVSDPVLPLPLFHVTVMVPDSMGLLAFCNCRYSFIWRRHLDTSCV